MLLNELRANRYKKVLQTVYTFPNFLSWVIIGGLMTTLFSSEGFVNMIIRMCGGETYNFLTNADLIRPLLYAGEGRIANLAKALALPIVENPCPEDRGSKRYEIKQFIRTMSQTYPDLRSKVFGAIQRAPLDGCEKAR